MGQYYHPIFLSIGQTIMAWLNAHEYNSGLKLMEHSFIDNNFMSTVEYELSPKGRFYKSHFVWAGDYADKEPDKEENLHHLCTEDSKIHPTATACTIYRYVVNHDKRQFVDKEKIPQDRDGLRIHPLALLTCEGNGRGGGDYHCRNVEEELFVGSWARNSISMEETPPEGYHEIDFLLKEEC